MSKWISLFAMLALVLCLPGAASRAEDISVPADTKFLIRLDFQALEKTAIGGKLLEIVKKQIGHESGGDDKVPSLASIKEMLGFDPFQEIRTVTVSASDYAHPEKSLMASIKMGKTTGNIEGLVLGVPGYQTEDYGKHLIYS